jgi:hypothetical protein
MIVRDEEANITRAIRSAKPFVDEIIVVDTGSRDGTATLAVELGAAVYSIAWTGFADARNVAIERCRRPWIFMLDADEELVDSCGPLVRLVGETRELRLHQIQQINYVQGREPVNVPIVRLFPNRRELRFQGVVHERLVATGLAVDAHMSPISVHHWGADANFDPHSIKNQQYRNILEERVATYPEDIESQLHLGIVWLRMGQFMMAYEQLCSCLSKTTGHEGFLPILFESLAVVSYELGRYEMAVAYCRQGLNSAPDFPPLYYNMALAQLRSGKPGEALQNAHRAVSATASYKGVLPFDASIGVELAPALIGLCIS